MLRSGYIPEEEICTHKNTVVIRMNNNIHHAKRVCKDCKKWLCWIKKPIK